MTDDLSRYTKAMVAGHISTCIAIEQKYGLFGYPPEVVCVGLSAAARGEDAEDAADRYCAGEYAEDTTND